MKKIAFFKQLDSRDCGPACLRTIANYYGKELSQDYIRSRCSIDRQGVSITSLANAAEAIGFKTLLTKLTYDTIDKESSDLLTIKKPCIAFWNKNHYVVVYKANRKHVWLVDPAVGKLKKTKSEFENGWYVENNTGVILTLEPGPDFYRIETGEEKKGSFSFLFRYLVPYKRLLIQLGLGMLLASVFQLIFPFLTQSVVDVGIQNQDIGFITTILIAQLVLFLSEISVTLIQGWILLHVSTRINVSLISDFLVKLMKLPIGFFETRIAGDLMQRINDHNRIENFLTNSSLSLIFSLFHLLIFSVVLLFYNKLIFFIYLVASVLYLAWVFFFLGRRKVIDNTRFTHMSENQNSLIELIYGMQEIKLQGSERKRLWKWLNIQSRLFRTNMRSLTIGQYQDTGGRFINQSKNIIISFIAAMAVINGDMTLGMMVAVQYIVGQLNMPLQQLISFIRSAQDAKISFERLSEIHNREIEDESSPGSYKIDYLPEFDYIEADRVSFSYTPGGPQVLKDISFKIPRGKITAIVGTSGSGKTTIIKLLLGFYKPTSGVLRTGDVSLNDYNSSFWRKKCGAVMQDGFIFSDTIANNISESDEAIHPDQLEHAMKMANMEDFIKPLPLGANTMVGAKGNGLSQGQRQRLLIARVIYKDPEFLFLDEATNALDSDNEKTIMNNLMRFAKGRTVIIVAHRLSTVRNADQIIVIDKGSIIESGLHTALVHNRGTYFHLIKNQLELGT